ncbi:MAG: precorrin-6Y C5,15-methyltransferase (decarboxylating) subunit CbiT [Odoribacter sp.]|nr:precorrin-6Y C5,15-methyltransferase (decarboxylating) subunit CbiT [Odoribacter sp.]
MYVGELLGNKKKEKINLYELKEIEGKVFETPNNIILIQTYSLSRPFGIADKNFNLLDGRAKMITKMPVRLLTLHMLDLREKKVFWDIGFCTGSVSIEAKMQFPHLKICAFEKREEGEEIIKTNCYKMGVPGISVFTGDFVETDVFALPMPDAVFIGGHGGRMKEIVDKISGLLNTGGTIVFNSVSEESKRAFIEVVENNQLTFSESYQIKVDDFNTIEVIKATKF